MNCLISSDNFLDNILLFLCNVEQFVPLSFHERYGCNVSSQVLVKCNKYVWCLKYNAEKMIIYGLERFMLYHGVSGCSVIQFDYYGDSLFVVSIFNEYAIECEYPEVVPENFFGSDLCLELDKRRYMQSHGTIAYENRCSLLWFNGKMNISEYYEVVVDDCCISGTVRHLVRLILPLFVFYSFLECLL